MIRHGEEFWRKVIEQQKASGLNATSFCKKRSLKRGTFLRWRKRLAGSGNDQGFVEIPAIEVPCFSLSENQGLEVQIGHDIRVTVYSDSDLELVAHVIAAIRRVS
jgi:hypothetical protein